MAFARSVSEASSSLPPKVDISEEFLEKIQLKGVTLRSYQERGLQWLVQRYSSRFSGCILGDDMGLGKTLQSVAFLLYLTSSLSGRAPVFLIVCPLSVTAQWSNELARVAPSLKVLVYTQSKEEREEEQTKLTATPHLPYSVILTTYEIVLKDAHFLQKYHWSALVVDEAHRLKSSSSKLHQTLSAFDVSFKLLLTGTPVQNNLQELYSLLAFISPEIFPLNSVEGFVSRYGNTSAQAMLDELHKVLEPVLLRRTRAEVLGDLPGRSDVLLYCGMTDLQKKYYKAFLMKDPNVFDESGSKNRLMNVLMNLRKCANHPYLFDGVEPEPFEIGEHLVDVSGKLCLIDKLLHHLKPRGHRILIFSQMTRMLDIIQDYLGYRGFTYERLDGSVRGEERFIALKNFANDEGTFVFLLSTRAGGVGLNLVGADTVLFVDSDFNPQNDLQAAARAHRIGQTRPVKIIHLAARHTVDQVIIQRAAAKMELTNKVIEGGQFSQVESASGGAGSTKELVEMLKFGLGALLESTDSKEEDIDFEEILGRSESGEWVERKPVGRSGQTTLEEGASGTEDNIYVFEGQDYSKVSAESDKQTFDQLLAKRVEELQCGPRERVLRSENKSVLTVDLPSTSRKRRTLSPEELEERRRKRAEAKAKRQKVLEEEEQRRSEERQRRRLEHWKKHGYDTAAVEVDSDDEELEEEAESDESCDLGYISGDVTHPQNTGEGDAIIVHCVDNSGRWGRGGVFSALSARSTCPEQQYELAHQMKDLHLGDVHLVAVDDLESRDTGRDFAALIVAQSRDRDGKLCGIKMEALNQGLQKIHHVARQKKASVHLPRIGYATPNFNWYGTERLIRKNLAARGIPTFIYYFPRKAHRTSQSQTPVSPIGADHLGTQHRSHDRAMTSSPAKGISQLPDVFPGVCALLCGCGQEERALTRYIVAYGGDTCSCVEEGPTHIVCGNDRDLPQHPPTVHVVLPSWVNDSVRQGKMADEAAYSLPGL